MSKQGANVSLMDKLDSFIDMAREVVEIAPPDDPDRIIWLHELGNTLSRRFTVAGVLADLEDSIKVGQEAIDAAPNDYIHRGALLDSLGVHLAIRFAKIGSLSDLEQAIQVTRQAIDVAADSDDDRAFRLTHLANHLGERYERTGSSIDLEEAIEVAQSAVDLTPLDDFKRPGRLNTLANQLHERYARTGILGELNKVIDICRGITKVTAEGSSDHGLFKSNLSGHLGDRYLRTGDTKDLDEAIQLAQEALTTLPSGHADIPSLSSNLSIWLAKRYIRYRETTDVEEAIKMGHQSITVAQPGNPSLAQYMSNLADCYWNRHTLTNCMDDFEAAVNFYRSALDHLNSNIQTRIAVGKFLFETFAHASKWQHALDASQAAFDLLPQLTPRSLGFVDKQRMLGRIVDLACDTAAVALHAGKEPFFALSVLEKGRGVLAAAIEQIRVDVLDLEQSHPDLAGRFLELGQVLDAPIQSGDSVSAQVIANRRGEASEELEHLIGEIRKHPGFSDFLEPPNEDDYRAAASSGPVVVINLSKFRCDAILVEQHQIRSLPLPDLTVDKMNEKESSDSLTSPLMMEWLWDIAAGPILQELGIQGPPPDDDWPHIWWVPTGRLSRLPFHAFGHHHPGSTKTVLDRVISSYSSSIQALINGRKLRSDSAQDKAVLVAMEDTTGQIKLPFVKEEVSAIAKLCKSMNLESRVPEQHKQAVLKELHNCKVFHFAGHGKTDGNPSQSGLLLTDGILTVSELMDINLRRNAPFLAYLSACGTGQIGGNAFFDESIHLISACQLAGFQHVVGTLWEVSDKSCVEISQTVYESIRDEGFSNRSVCWGLHKATRQLRDKWLSTPEQHPDRMASSERDEIWSRDILSCGEDEEKMKKLVWVPFVHFG
ncbi:30S ribosomal S17P protein [Fusarium subglutinans]|uniref:30S ribosomal S17P protein n=1 Tax=Gibberella subglutinans TaxID=42677 RepID=A0A8H5QE57_GIBSU|nr:30S ribosomal S17P protein [Fusarium subglutinans]KAF5612368.1 30S ribosomal S17P protein [Fusarium subglutinans]